MCLQVEFVNFFERNLAKKAARKMLVKLTLDRIRNPQQFHRSLQT